MHLVHEQRRRACRARRAPRGPYASRLGSVTFFTYPLTHLPTYLLTHLPTYLLAYYLLTLTYFLPTYLPTCPLTLRYVTFPYVSRSGTASSASARAASATTRCRSASRRPALTLTLTLAQTLSRPLRDPGRAPDRFRGCRLRLTLALTLS